MTVFDTCALPFVGFDFSARSVFDPSLIAGCILVPIAILYTFVRPDEKIASMAASSSVLFLATPVLCLFTYITCALSARFPLRDAALGAFDEALGFHWPSYLHWSAAHPWLVQGELLAYSSILFQAAAAVVALSFCNQSDRLQRLMLAFILGAVICGTVACVIPALDAYSYYGIDPAQHEHIRIISKDVTSGDVLSLRSGRYGVFSFSRVDGIITFPSFHSTLGVLFAWAFWRVPYLRWLSLALNAAMIGATPLQGSHYLTDVLAGFVVAAIAIGAASRLSALVAARFDEGDAKRARRSMVPWTAEA